MLEYRDVYAGGRLVGSASPDVITIVNPATEEIVGTVPAAVGPDVDQAVRAARRAFDDGHWATCNPAQRAAAMERLAAAIEARAEDAARLVTAEMGMPIAYSRQSNAGAPCTLLRYYAGLARHLATEETRPAVSFAGQTLIRREPAGVAAVIVSWNYPLMLAFCQLAPALAAGCTIVLKPAAATSLSAYILAEAFEAASFPPGVFNLVTGTHEAASLLARHPGVDTVAYAGPTAQGRRIAAICGAELKPAKLELGGQAAAIVLDDADLDRTAGELAQLCFSNSGQTCFAMSRVLVPERRRDDLVDALSARAAGLVVGDPLAEATTMGPLASARRRSDVEGRVRASVAGGARVASGGRRPASPVRGYYYEPTVLTDVTPSMPIARDEVCGPVASVLTYRDEASAVAFADSGFGLAATVWTADAQRGLDIARRARVGTFGINQYVPDIGSPWGGRGLSGPGVAFGPEGMDSYLMTKSVFLPPEPAVP
ncbi:MAG TPA: aldehyde dehydrogenase family protein [Trebonia sp.]|nr:aldehyde dehydrogenase family protein [Trebonia sp.]